MTGTGYVDFQRFGAVTAILVAPLSYLPMFMLLWAISFDFSILGTPGELLTLGADGAVIIKWVMILDLVGQSLL